MIDTDNDKKSRDESEAGYINLLHAPDSTLLTTAYDGWLDKHFSGIPGKLSVVELGCGWGDDTSFLSGTGHNVTSCDIADDMLDKINKRHPGVITRKFDMREPFPLETDAADVVIASLCLHFFEEPVLRCILSEIKRVLKGTGTLLCRLNSENGYIAGIAGETKLAQGSYLTSEGLKLFYNEDKIRSVFTEWDIISIEEYETAKLSKRVVLFEVVLRVK